MNIKKLSKLFILGLFAAFSQTPISCCLVNPFPSQDSDASSVSVNSDKKFISNALVLLVGVSEYEDKNLGSLPTIVDEMGYMYATFAFECRYDTHEAFKKIPEFDQGFPFVRPKSINSHKFKLTLQELNTFLKKEYNNLINKDNSYDGLIFVYSGHGFIDSSKQALITTSDTYLDKNKIYNCKYFSDIVETLIKPPADQNKNDLFYKTPKIFFNLACQTKLESSISIDKEDITESEEKSEDKENFILAQNRKKEKMRKILSNVCIFNTTAPGLSSDTYNGLQFSKSIFNRISAALLGNTNQDHSLQGILKLDTQKSFITNSQINSLMPSDIFFQKKKN